MSISRRQFLLSIPALGAGFIIPSFFDKVLSFVECNGEPLLVPPKNTMTRLIAIDRGYGDLELNLGDPMSEPPRLTVQGLIDNYYDGDTAEYCINWDVEMDELDLTSEVDFFTVLDFWGPTSSPNARAFHLLKGIDLGPELGGVDAVGEVVFTEGCHPGNDYVGVHAPDLVSLSLLQHRLNQINTGISIQLWDEG